MIVRLRSRWVIIPLILLILAIGYWFLDRYLGERKWEAYAASARARGVKLTAEEYFIAPNPPIPDGENFATAPVWQRERSRKSEAEAPAAPEVNFSRWVTGERLGTNVSYDFKKLRAELIEQKWLPIDDTAGNDAEAVLRAMSRNDAVLQELHEACSRPHSSFFACLESGSSGRLASSCLDAIQPHNPI